MNEKPILFSGEMVKAILDGRKTMTRRVIKPQPDKKLEHLAGAWFTHYWQHNGLWNDDGKVAKCPYGQPGDRLWVRETFKGAWKKNGRASEYWLTYRADNKKVLYRTAYIDDFENWPNKWRPSIFMPRWASRITLQITNVRVEHIQGITECDAMFEGLWNGYTATGPDDYHQRKFAELWNKLNVKRGFGWDANPWVWVIEFQKVGG